MAFTEIAVKVDSADISLLDALAYTESELGTTRDNLIRMAIKDYLDGLPTNTHQYLIRIASEKTAFNEGLNNRGETAR
jgi:hypothetical protein